MNDTAKLTFQQDASLPWPLTSAWWAREFVEATQGGVAPYLFKSVLPSHFPGPDEVTNAFRSMQKLHDVKNARVRVYLGEERRDDLIKKALGSPFLGNESLVHFMVRITGEKRFSLVLNRLQDWSDPLTASVGALLQSMFVERGVPLGGSEMVVFAGNYAGTAFGVHRGFEHAFLIHLGPGTKDFHCWSEQLYTKLTGSLEPTFGDYEHLLSSSEKFVLEPGDVLYLPAFVFHVGRQDDFSVSVACPLYTYPIKRLLKQVLSNLVEHIPFDETGASPHQPWVFTAHPVQEFASSVAEGLFDDWMKTQIPTVLEDYWLRLISNGGFDLSESPIDATGQETGLTAPLPLEAGGTLRLKEPYKICWSSRNGDTGDVQVFLRGHCVTVPFAEKLITLFEHLNAGHEIALEGLSAVVGSLQKLSRTNGFEVV